MIRRTRSSDNWWDTPNDTPDALRDRCGLQLNSKITQDCLKDPTTLLERRILSDGQVFNYNIIMLLNSKGLGPDTWFLYQ